METNYVLHKNKIVQYLKKSSSVFTREDIVKYVVDNEVEMVNFMYPAADGRLKTLNFVITDYDYLINILTTGERVDGSSLFPFIEAGNSDLYALPRFSTAFEDPFASVKTVSMLCSFFGKDGNPLEGAPEQTLKKACEKFSEETGMEFYAMGELEYYVITPQVEAYPATDQHGYHESAPFAKTNDFRTQCMAAIAATGGQIKYGHSEVGNFVLDNKIYEQNEIEFQPVPAQEAADQLMLAKWAIRNLAYREGYDVTFAPKITTGKAGSGLHIHMKLMKDGMNMMLDTDKHLSDDAKRMIAGILEMAPSLTAFGNCNPTSYFRLVPHQEAPTNICWGDRNRSVLVRVPLGWTAETDMCSAVNPGTEHLGLDPSQKQTVEIRSADGSANVYIYLAGLAVAARLGFEMDNALDIAKKTYVNVNIHKSENVQELQKLASLPANCSESADALSRQRHIYEAEGIFSPAMIERTIRDLKQFDDKGMVERAKNDPALMQELVNKYFYCG